MKNEKPKLALIYDAVYPYIKGGGEKRFYEVGKRLSKSYQVHFYGMKLWKGRKAIQKDGMFYHGICKAMPLYNRKKRTIFQAIFFGFSSLKLLWKDFDIIDCCGFPYFSLFSAKLACVLKAKPLYSTWHEVWGKDYWKKYIGWKGIFGYWIEKLAVKMPTRIIAISEHTSKRLQSLLNVKKEKIITIPNGIEIKNINKIKPSKEKSDIIFAGRLLKNKNVDLLIKSIGEIKNSNIKCVIIGDGPERKDLEKLSRQLNLTKNIKFKGFVKKMENVYALIKSSKVFVLPSTREGFGIVVVEANACGIPVITINHEENASKDLIKKGENGFVCELNKEELIRNINKALKNYKKMRKDCINTAKQYDWGKIIKQFEEVYGK